MGREAALQAVVLRHLEELMNYLPPSMDSSHPKKLKKTTFTVCRQAGERHGGGESSST